MRQKLFSVFFIFALVLSASAQNKHAEVGKPRVERLRTHVTRLASDRLDGRRTGTQGSTRAAYYIIREFVRYGLRPGVKLKDKSNPYLQSFPYVAGVELGKTNAISLARRAPAIPGEPLGGGITTIDFHLNDDWTPLGFSTNVRLYTQPLTFVGYGITASDLKYDDYAGADVKDRVALAFAGTPDGDNPHGEFARFDDVRWKAIAARDHHAKALIVIAREEKFKDDKLATLRYDNNAGDAGLPVLAVSRQAAAQILGLGGTQQLAELEKRLVAAAAARRAGTQPSYPVVDAINNATFMEQSRVTIATSINRRNAPAYNVVGVLEGSDPQLKKEVIVIGAHYDHLGRGGAGSLAPRSGEIHYGADDNASGVAGMLELARLFSQKNMRPKRTLVFIAFSGEEEGLIGSNYYVNHPVVPIAQTIAMMNMDMIGRLAHDKLIVGGVGTSTQWREMIGAANQGTRTVTESHGFKPTLVRWTNALNVTFNEDGYGPSDHSSFYSKQVPVLFFWTGTHEDYHKPTDTADKINYEGEARVLMLVMDLVRAIDGNQKRPEYAVAKSESTGRSMGFKVSLGTIPNYAESTDGLKLDGVRDDSPASKAGLIAGDVIVKLAGRDIKNVYDYTYSLGEMKAGEEYEVELMRAGQRLKFKIIPAARK